MIIPYYVFWIVGLVGAIIIYFKILDERTKADVKKFLKAYGIWIAIILGWLFFRQRWGFFTEEDWFGRKANITFLLVAIVWGFAKSFLGRERYVSTQAICDNRSGSCASYEEKGEYVVLNIGSIDATAFPWEWGHESWVVPKRHFNKINNVRNQSKTQIKCETQVQKCDLVEVPSQIHDFIETTSGYNKDNVYYGEFSLEEVRKKLKIRVQTKEGEKELTLKEYEDKLKDTNRLLNEARTMLKGKTSAIKGFVSDASTIQKKALGKSAFSSSPPPKDEGY